MRIQAWIRQGSSATYYAHCPSLPGCAVTADSVESAEQELLKAIRSYLYSYNVAPSKGLLVEFRWSGGGPRGSVQLGNQLLPVVQTSNAAG